MHFGVYTWIYAKGNFQVEIRPFNNVFYCAQYSAGGTTWSADGDTLLINWKKYGEYEFILKSPDPVVYEGNAVGDKENWRRLEFLRPFSPEELLLQGEHGAGTVWNFEYALGSFEIQFMFDAYNHFVCPDYPAHSHWKMIDGKKIDIDWGKYGQYELTIDAFEKRMNGNKKGQPENWRKATFIRAITPSDTESSAHSHAHDH